jgi:hypothetical protein
MKTPGRRQAFPGVGEQLHLIPPPPFAPRWPNPRSLPGVALSKLLQGRGITHPEFEGVTRSWRLAEPIRALRHEFGWPVETIEIHSPTRDAPHRYIAHYMLPGWVLAAVGDVR